MNTDPQIGSSQVSVVEIPDVTSKYAIGFSVVNNNEWILSEDKLVIGGIPIALFEKNGKYAIGTFVYTDAVEDGTVLFLNGVRLGTANFQGKYAILARRSEYESDLSETVLNGMPIGTNSDNALLVREEDINPYTEESSAYIGGLPITVRRKEGNWYLAIYEI